MLLAIFYNLNILLFYHLMVIISIDDEFESRIILFDTLINSLD